MSASVRQFDTPISGNRRKSKEYSEEIKGQAIGLYKAGYSVRKISTELQIPRSTIHDIKQKWIETGSVQNQPRSGRPLALSRSEERYIILRLKRNRRMTYAALADGLDARISRSTLHRLLRRLHMYKWIAKKRIPLNKDTRRA